MKLRFLVDESTGPAVAHWLQSEGHDTRSVYDDCPGTEDEILVHQALKERRILITNDKDFGEKVFRLKMSHAGIVLLRLDDERPQNIISVLKKLIHAYGNRLAGHFIVSTENRVRFARD